MTSPTLYPADIIGQARSVANAVKAESWKPIADALLAERQSLQGEIQAWRDKWRVASFSMDADAAIADCVRTWTKEITNYRCTWVDDDLRLLAILADVAVAHGLIDKLPQEVQNAILEKQQEYRNTPVTEE